MRDDRRVVSAFNNTADGLSWFVYRLGGDLDQMLVEPERLGSHEVDAMFGRIRRGFRLVKLELHQSPPYVITV